MRTGFIIPTDLECTDLPPEESHIVCAGYGAGKAAACSAAAELIYEKNCDTVLIWGLAGGLSPALQVGDVLIGTHVAYKDYNIYPLANSTGTGYVQGFAENLWHPLDEELSDLLFETVRKIFPEKTVLRGNICTGDQFVQHQSTDQYNRIEQKALAVDMESAAVAHFCYNLKKKVRFGVIRVISDNANHSADLDFTTFLQQFAAMNRALPRLREVLENMDPQNKRNALPATEKEVWKILENRVLFEQYTHKLYDLFYREIPESEKITKIAGIEARGCFFAQELARMLQKPFIPVRKEKNSALFALQEGTLAPEDNVLLVDDLLHSGKTAGEALCLIRSCGAACAGIMVLNRTAEDPVEECRLREENIPCFSLNTPVE